MGLRVSQQLAAANDREREPDNSGIRDTAGPPVRPTPWYGMAFRGAVSVGLVVAIAAGAMAFQRHLIATKPTTPVAPSLEQARPVAIATVVPKAVEPSLTLYGQIAAGRSVDLRVLVAGEVVSVAPALVEGGRIARDAALVTVETFEYEGALIRARAELAEAEARIAESRVRIEAERAARRRAVEQEEISTREVERLTTLQGRGFTSDAALDQSRSRQATAMAAVESRDNQVRVLEAQIIREEASLDRLRWNVKKAERDIRNTMLRAPFDGIVSNVAAEVGRLLNVNDRIATIVDIDRFEVRFALSDAQYGRLVADGARLEGRPVTVRWRGGASVLESMGTIDRVSPTVSSVTGGFDVFARLAGSQATLAMRPGAFVTVTTRDVVYDNVIELPQSAIHPGNRLFVVGSDSRLKEVVVEVAGYSGELVLVRGPVPAGATVMISRLPDAGPGVLVKPTDAR